MITRCIRVSGIFRLVLLILLSTAANASLAGALIGLGSYPSGTAVDGGPSYGWTTDGNFDALLSTAVPILGGNRVFVAKTQGADASQQMEKRAIFEFPMPAALSTPGITIIKATLSLPKYQYGTDTMASNTILRVYGYAGNGQVELSDFANTSNLVLSINDTSPPFFADITSYMQSVVGNVAYVSFVVAVDTVGTSFELDASASISVEYTSPINNPPMVNITSPAPNSQFSPGAPVTFNGFASDLENAGVGPISWSSSIDGFIGTGSQVTTSTLTVGAHTITAKATDPGGLTGQAVVNIAVSSVPIYCDARGNTANYEWINSLTFGAWTNTSGINAGYGNFVSLGQVPMAIGANTVSFVPGFSGGSYTEYWRLWVDLNRDGTFAANELLYSGIGASPLTGIVTIPTGTPTGPARMRVAMSYGSAPAACGSFSYGEVEDYTASLGAIAPPPPPPPPPPPSATYCASKGGNTSYEWINQITLAGVLRYSGANGGYTNQTAATPFALARGVNAISLFPGFGSSSYLEHWRVWIDFNQDKAFTDDEIVYSGNSTGTINTSIGVPTTAKSGLTRMRVSMKYGSLPTSCEAFSYGEVEDHTVAIP